MNLFNGVDLFSLDGPKQILANAMIIAFWFVGVLSVIFLIIGGIMYASSFGQPDRLRQAKNAITWSIAGLVIAMSAYLIVNVVVTQFK
ncbi:hypothetical protein IT414_00945 [bacterium]|nr:hypothetical protein [bacterium]